MYGSNGKILRVSLDSGENHIQTLSENFYRKYNGNGILGAYFLLTETKPGIDALSSDNLLMFLSGAVCGLEAPGLSRFVVCGKSPLTNGIGEARSEGPFALAIKRTGYDGIVIKGCCNLPSYLLIDSGKARLVEAPELWGLSVGDTTDALEQKYPGSHYAVIGPAGETMVRFANIVSDRCHHASRSGMGAVMGSKNLKAVVLRGGNLPDAFDPQALRNRYQWFEEKMRRNTLSMWQHDQPGFSCWIHTHGLDSSIGVNNYSTAKFTDDEPYKPDKFAPYYKGEATCPGCPNHCIKRYSSGSDDERAGGIHQEVTGAMGPNLSISDVEYIFKANTLCNQLGMDPNSLGYTISFAVECANRGLLDSDGLNLCFGNDLDLLPLIEKIAHRQGIGDLLAEGSSRAAAKLGGEAHKYALTVKHNEITPFEPRSQTNLAIGFAVSPVGPRYEICEHDWDFDTQVGWEHTLNYCRTLGILDRIPMGYLGADKVRNYKQLSNLWSACDAIGICLFSAAPTRVYSLEDMAVLVREVTGWETSSYEVMRLGELRNQIFRLYNTREGLTPEDDMLPDLFYEQDIDYGPHKGVHLDRQLFRKVMDCYYEMMGWDQQGRLRPATLIDYGLHEIIDKAK